MRISCNNLKIQVELVTKHDKVVLKRYIISQPIKIRQTQNYMVSNPDLATNAAPHDTIEMATNLATNI